MEIYKLSDQVPSDRGSASSHGSPQPRDTKTEYTITALRQGVKRPNRVNVFINNQYSFSLDITQVVDFKLKVGKAITDDELAKLKQASAYGKEYQRALEWALLRPRSQQELRDYLRRRSASSDYKERQKEWAKEREISDLIARGENIDAVRLQKRLDRARISKKTQEKYDFSSIIIKRLTERGYVDDRKFAEYYVENRFTKKGISRRRLEQELIKKGISRDIIDEVLSSTNRTDESEITKIIAKKRTKYDDDKLIAYLCRQGFAYDLVSRLVKQSD